MTERVRKRLTQHFLFLGKSGPKFNCYKIRYLVRRKSPNLSELFRSTSECLRSRDAGQPMGWSLVVGRGALFSLQLIVFAIGAIDLCLSVRQRSGAAHLTLTAVEVILATIQMTLRLVSIRTDRKRTIAEDLSLSSDGNDVTEQLMTLRSTLRRVLSVVGMLMIVTNVVCFPLFYLFLDLRWSHLTSSLLILCLGRIHEVLETLERREFRQMDADSSRVVLYEASQLLQEQFCLRSPEARIAYDDVVNRFLLALKNTPCYSNPDNNIQLEEGKRKSLSTTSSYQADDEPGTPAEGSHLSCL